MTDENLIAIVSEPEFDEAGYPTDQTLEVISQWSVSSKPVLQALFDFIEEALNLDYGSFSLEGETVRIATGGWSGNESVIGALQQNHAFWGLCWESSHRGGLHWFYSPEYVFRAVPPEPRSLIIDEATQFGEAEALYLSRRFGAAQPEEGELKVGADSHEKSLVRPDETVVESEAEGIILNPDLRSPEEVIEASALSPEDKAGLMKYVEFRRDRARAENLSLSSLREDVTDPAYTNAYAEFRKRWAPELAVIESENNQDE